MISMLNSKRALFKVSRSAVLILTASGMLTLSTLASSEEIKSKPAINAKADTALLPIEQLEALEVTPEKTVIKISRNNVVATSRGNAESSTNTACKNVAADGKYQVVEEQKGVASWYGPGFHGKKTANGESFDMLSATAAHRWWPLGSWVRVTNPSNKRSVLVRINDRGPYHGNRILDVSKAVAQQLGFIYQGSTTVVIERLRGIPKFVKGLGQKVERLASGRAQDCDVLSDAD